MSEGSTLGANPFEWLLLDSLKVNRRTGFEAGNFYLLFGFLNSRMMFHVEIGFCKFCSTSLVACCQFMHELFIN